MKIIHILHCIILQMNFVQKKDTEHVNMHICTFALYKREETEPISMLHDLRVHPRRCKHFTSY